MLLSEMFGVEQDVDFEVIGYTCIFMIREQSDGTERLLWRLKDNYIYVNEDLDVVYDIIFKAPSGIIHLPPPLTDEQREQLKAIWTLGGRWLAKDKYCSVRYYRTKPGKGSVVWYAEDEMGYGSEICQSLGIWNLPAWSDPEPYDIGKALGVTE